MFGHKRLLPIFSAAIALAMIPLFAKAEDIHIDCSAINKQAQLQVPKPANKFARVACTKYGHAIEPVKGRLWNGVDGAVNPIIFPAQLVEINPNVTNNDVYFRSLSVKEFVGKEAKKKWLMEDVMRNVQATDVKKALELVALSSQGGRHIIYFFDNGWGYGCSPECARGRPFKILNGGEEPASW